MSSSRAAAERAAEEERRKKAEAARLARERASSLDRMVKVPSCRYTVGDNRIEGCPEDEFSTRGFWIDMYEVTNAEYKLFADHADYPYPRSWDGDIPEGKDNHPVTTISFHEAKAYAEWVNKRLPKASEWELAARGQNTLKYPWGDKYEEGRCNDESAGLADTCPVDAYPLGKSPFGCFNMAGNVEEWTSTKYQSEAKRDERIVKGGGFDDSTFDVQSSQWKPVRAAVDRIPAIGFRCVKDLE